MLELNDLAAHVGGAAGEMLIDDCAAKVGCAGVGAARGGVLHTVWDSWGGWHALHARAAAHLPTPPLFPPSLRLPQQAHYQAARCLFMAHALLAGGKPREAGGLFGRAVDRCKHAARWVGVGGAAGEESRGTCRHHPLPCSSHPCFCPRAITALPPCRQYEACARPDVPAGQQLAALQAAAVAWGTVAAAELEAAELREKEATRAGLEGVSLEADAEGGCC